MHGASILMWVVVMVIVVFLGGCAGGLPSTSHAPPCYEGELVALSGGRVSCTPPGAAIRFFDVEPSLQGSCPANHFLLIQPGHFYTPQFSTQVQYKEGRQECLSVL